VDELKDLLKSSWGAEKWIDEGWNQITAGEKQLIKDRMDDMFKNGLPFALKKDKLLYIYTFSMLAQLEVLAIQIPLKFESRMSTPLFRQRMRTQLLDEIFHGLVFTKIVYLLCEPYASPPAYNNSFEQFCDFIRNETCPKIAVVLLNLIAECWIEELFYALRKSDVAPEVFDIILEDEHRHVCEADLYCEIGLPEKEAVIPKLEYLEEQLLTNVFFQYKYVTSLRALLGVQASRDYVDSIHKKHTHQLSKIGLVPGKTWRLFMRIRSDVMQNIQEYLPIHQAVDMTPMRKLFMNIWDAPGDPTMVAHFNVDVTCLDVFNKKFPPETLTTLMMQSLSQLLMDHESLRKFLVHKAFYQSQVAYISLVVKLPNCGDHFGSIIFANAHTLSSSALFFQVRQAVRLMVYCYKKREQLETEHPHLKLMSDHIYTEYSTGVYPYPEIANPSVSLTNLGGFGYAHIKSPLLKNESMKFTLLDVERKQVWNKKSNVFEVRDLLSVSVSADHRIADGNVPVGKMMASIFETMFQRTQACTSKLSKQEFQYKHIITMVESLLEKDMSEQELNMVYATLSYLQTTWPAFLPIDELIPISKSQMFLLKAKERFRTTETA
jgi:hypothetical protein